MLKVEEDVVGFVQSVENIKVSQRGSRYFQAVLQTGHDEFHRLVCFAADKRAQLLQSAACKQAVKLGAVQKGVSKYWFLWPVSCTPIL